MADVTKTQLTDIGTRFYCSVTGYSGLRPAPHARGLRHIQPISLQHWHQTVFHLWVATSVKCMLYKLFACFPLHASLNPLLFFLMCVLPSPSHPPPLRLCSVHRDSHLAYRHFFPVEGPWLPPSYAGWTDLALHDICSGLRLPPGESLNSWAVWIGFVGSSSQRLVCNKISVF